MSRISPTYPRTPVGGVYIPGTKSIEASTGDTAQTGQNWIESEKYKWFIIQTATATSAEFDTAITRTGAKTLKLSTTDTAGRMTAALDNAVGFPAESKYYLPVKASTAYVFKCYCKTTTVAADSVFVVCREIDAAGGTVVNNDTNKLTGTNDWTLLTSTFTTGASTKWIRLFLRNIVAGNVSDAWFDVNSMTLTETLPRTAPTYPRTPVGGVYIPGAKSIEASTGDIARTNSGFVEDAKYNWYCNAQATAISSEFDTAITRTGGKTVKLSTTDATGRIYMTTFDVAPTNKKAPLLKANTQYVFSCYVKTNNCISPGAFIRINDGTNRTSNTLIGTNDWTLCTVTWTTGGSPVTVSYVSLQNNTAGNISDAWFDVNSMTLTEVLPRNPVA